MNNLNDLNSWGLDRRKASSAEMVRARRKKGTTTDEVSTNHTGHCATGGSKTATRMVYFRVSTMLVTVLAAAIMAVLAGQKPAAAGVQLGDGVSIPPPPPGG